MASGSRKVVLLALGANFGIGLLKLGAAVFTKSGAMLAEAIHSFADSGNQALLLLGGARAAKPPTERHPLGYGREAYFWAMLVAVILFTLGGGFSIYEGLHKLQHPEPVSHPMVAIGVLLGGVLLEGYSLHAAWKECSKERGEISLLEWGGTTGNVDLLIVTFEDLAAMAGLVIALAAVALTWTTGDPTYDALGSCIVGVTLLGVAVFVGWQVRRLIVGFAVGQRIRETIAAIWDEQGFDILRLIAVWSGPGRIVVAIKIKPREPLPQTRDLITKMNEAERAVRGAVPEIAFQFCEPDLYD